MSLFIIKNNRGQPEFLVNRFGIDTHDCIDIRVAIPIVLYQFTRCRLGGYTNLTSM